jgi:hypothetical protein
MGTAHFSPSFLENLYVPIAEIKVPFFKQRAVRAFDFLHCSRTVQAENVAPIRYLVRIFP